MIHWALAREAPNSFWIVGSATWMTEKSTTSRNTAAMTTARITRRRDASGSLAGDAGCSTVSCFMFSCLGLGGPAPSPHTGSRGRGAKVPADASARRAGAAMMTELGWGPHNPVPCLKARQELREAVPRFPRTGFHPGSEHPLEVLE